MPAGTRRYASTRSRSRHRPGSRACREASSGTCSACARPSSRSACWRSTSRRNRSSTASGSPLSGTARAISNPRIEKLERREMGACHSGRPRAERDVHRCGQGDRQGVLPRRRLRRGERAGRGRGLRLRAARPGRRARLPSSGRGRPIVAGAPVTIQRNAGSGWTNVATAELDATGHFSADLTVTPASYRARFAPRHGVLAGVSPILRVVARARRPAFVPNDPLINKQWYLGQIKRLRLLAGAPAARADQDRGHRLRNRRQARRVPGPDLRIEELRLFERARRHAGSRNLCRRRDRGRDRQRRRHRRDRLPRPVADREGRAERRDDPAARRGEGDPLGRRPGRSRDQSEPGRAA